MFLDRCAIDNIPQEPGNGNPCPKEVYNQGVARRLAEHYVPACRDQDMVRLVK